MQNSVVWIFIHGGDQYGGSKITHWNSETWLDDVGECWLFTVMLDANECYCTQLIYVKLGAVVHADFSMIDSFKVEGKYSFKWGNEWNRIRITRL